MQQRFQSRRRVAQRSRYPHIVAHSRPITTQCASRLDQTHCSDRNRKRSTRGVAAHQSDCVLVCQVEESVRKGFTVQDIRFTTRGDTLYVLGLERPQDGAVLVKTLYQGTPYLDRPIAGIELLGSGAVRWEQTPKGLSVTLPADTSGGMPYALKLSFKK